MVSWGEILVTVTAAGYLLGRKELPKLAHFGGTYVGRSVGAIIRAKKEFFDATKDSDLVKLQREFQRGIEELNEIRSELTTVGSMQRPMQPSGAVEEVKTGLVAAASAASLSFQGVDAAQVPKATPLPAGARSSVSLASDYEGLEDDGGERTEAATLAIAELKLARQGKYTTRIESLEGGADYVSASIMDSLLLKKQSEAGKPKKS